MTINIFITVKYAFIILASFVAIILVSSCSLFEDEEPIKEEIDPRDAFIGTYIVDEECGSFTDRYSITIEKFGWGQLSIFNLYDAGRNHTSSVIEDNQLESDSRAVVGQASNGCNIRLENISGSLNGNRLVVGFTINTNRFDGGLSCQEASFSCFISGTK
ncbi:MAG: hypothetical protein AAF806_13255 [Bacteroidota bacterium]